MFFVCGAIDLWSNFIGPTYDSFVSAQRNLCVCLLLQRRKEYENHYIDCNKVNRLARSELGVREWNQRKIIRNQIVQLRRIKALRLVVQSQTTVRILLTRTWSIELVRGDTELMNF